jgi:hypothetical protein
MYTHEYLLTTLSNTLSIVGAVFIIAHIAYITLNVRSSERAFSRHYHVLLMYSLVSIALYLGRTIFSLLDTESNQGTCIAEAIFVTLFDLFQIFWSSCFSFNLWIQIFFGWKAWGRKRTNLALVLAFHTFSWCVPAVLVAAMSPYYQYFTYEKVIILVKID